MEALVPDADESRAYIKPNLGMRQSHRRMGGLHAPWS